MAVTREQALAELKRRGIQVPGGSPVAPPPTPIPAARPSADAARQELARRGIAIPPLSVDVPQGVQKVAQALYSPVRAARAAGVGFQRLTEGVPLPLMPGQAMTPQDAQRMGTNVPNAIARTKAAFQPGYVAPEGERAGSAIGEAGALTALSLPLASAAAPVASAAAAGAGMLALQQASERGRVNLTPAVPKSIEEVPGMLKQLPDTVAGAAGMNAGLAGLPGIVQFTRKSIDDAANKILPGLVAKANRTPERATEIFLKDPSVTTRYKGTIEAIEGRATALGKKLVEARRELGKRIGAIKESLGIPDPFKAVGEREVIERAGASRSPGGIERAYLKYSSPPKPSSPIVTETKDPFTGAISRKVVEQKVRQAPPQKKLAYLIRLRQQIDDKLDFQPVGTTVAPVSTTQKAMLHKLRGMVDEKITALPGGRRLKKAEEGFSQLAGLYDTLQRSLKDPGTATDTLIKIFNRDPNAVTAGRTRQVERILRDTDRAMGTNFTQEIFKELTSKAYKNWVGRGLTNTAIGAGAVGGATATKGIMGKVAAGVGAIAVSPRLTGEAIKAGRAIGQTAQRAADVAGSAGIRSPLIAALMANKGRKEKKK